MKFVDKYILHIFRLDVFIHYKLFKCDRMTGWGTQDPRRDLRRSRLDSSHMDLIQ